MSIDIDLDAVRKGLHGRSEPLRLTVHPGEDEPELSARFAELAETLRGAAPEAIVVERATDDTLPAQPGLTLSCGDRGGITYLALPEGQEAPPFVEAILTVTCGLDGLGEGWSPRLAELEAPAELLVFVATACPHCPLAVSAANRIAVANPLARSVIIDAQRYPQLSKRFGAKSVPLTVIDGGLSLPGVVPAPTLVDHLLTRSTVEQEALIFSSLVDVGRIDELRRRLQLPLGPPAFAVTWRGSTTSSRVGLLLAVEELLDEEPRALDAAVEGLLPALQADDAALQGDTADLLGRIGHPDAAPGLKRLLDHPNPDVAEIAAEALEELGAGSEG